MENDLYSNLLMIGISAFGVGFTVWAFVVRSATSRFSEQMSLLVANIDKIDQRFGLLESQLRRHETDQNANMRDVRKDIEGLREKMQTAVNYHGNRITKIEAHAERMDDQFNKYRNGDAL